MPALRLRHTTAVGAIALSLSLALALSACGGGESGGGGTPLTYPTSGSYGWTLKVSGPTDNLKNGISLVHPSLPDNEYVVEPASDVISDSRLVLSGTVDPAQLTASNLQPHTLVYIYGGDVRSVSMQANGAAPALTVKRSFSSSACRFVVTANDHGTPENSRFIVSTAGADGICRNADDGLAEVRLATSGGGLVYTPLTGADLPLDVWRDPASLAPRGWVHARHIDLWSTGAAADIALRTASEPAITRVIATTPESILVEDSSGLGVHTFGTGNTATRTPLDATLAGGTGWRLIGYDESAFYVYTNPLNPDPDARYTSPWRVLRITRANPAATQLVSGTGVLSVSSMGTNVLYLSGLDPANNFLVRIHKTTGAANETTVARTTELSVQTSASGRHLQSTITNVGQATVRHSVAIVNENGDVLHSFPESTQISVASSGSEDFNRSESRTRFIFATGFGVRAFADASLVSYDAAGDTTTTLGTLPGTAEFGSSFVYASAIGGPGSFGAGFAVRSRGGTYDDAGTRVFSFTLGSANSLRTATRR